MVLALITKDRRNLRLLKPETSNLLKDYFGNRNSVSEDKGAQARKIFAWMRNHDYFLVCDCERDPRNMQAPPSLVESLSCPLRTPALPGLFRALPNNVHHNDCIFARESSVTSSVSPRVVKADINHLAVFGRYPAVRQEQPGARPFAARPNGRSLPSISQVLFSILEASGLNRLDGKTALNSPARQAYNRSDEIFLTPGFAVQEALVTGDADSEKFCISQIIKLKNRIKEPNADWPADLRPQGYFCGIVRSYTSNANKSRYDVKVAGWKNQQFLETRPHVFSGYTADGAQPPYIAIFGYALPEENARNALGLRSFMQPCYSDTCWFPVDSNYERQTLGILLDFQRDLPDYQIVIDKPVFNVVVKMVDGKAQSCKPDFVVSFVRDGLLYQVAVETMGFTTEEYEQRKNTTHRLMLERFGGLIQHAFEPARRFELRRLFKLELEEHIKQGYQPAYATIRNGA